MAAPTLFLSKLRILTAALVLPVAIAGCTTAGVGRSSREPVVAELSPEAAPTYADLVALASAAATVGVVIVEDQTLVPLERAPGLASGKVRLYVESAIQRLLKSPTALGESLNFLVDKSPDQDGKPPRLKRQAFVFFAVPVPGQIAAVQLVSSDSLVPAGPVIEARLEKVLTQLAAADALPPITGVKDVISVAGNLAGESETQMFVQTASGAPVSLSVVRRPGMAPEWGVSLGEIVDQAARPPEPETIAWYRFACELPEQLPDDSYLQTDRPSRRQAQEDYAFVQRELGPCERRIG